MLSKEIGTHDEVLDRITTTAAPTLREAFGIGPDSAAEMMIVAGDNPERIRSDAASAKLCGACPIPASTGITNRHRLFRGGHRQANAALYRIVIVPHALAPTDSRLRHAPHRPGPVQEKHHPLPEAIRRPGDLQRAHHRSPVPRSTHWGRLTSHITTLLTYRGVSASPGPRPSWRRRRSCHPGTGRPRPHRTDPAPVARAAASRWPG